MENKLKDGFNEKNFVHPDGYETMSVKKAIEFLDLARDGHGALFEPDDYSGFKALLVLKCGIDIDYAFGDSFKEDIDEIEKHEKPSNLSPEELKEEVKKRASAYQQEMKEKDRKDAIAAAKVRYRKLSPWKRMSHFIHGTSAKNSYLEGKTVHEIDDMYEPSWDTRRLK